MEQLSNNLCFGGQQLRFKHQASTTACEMHFSLYLPPQASAEQPVPLIYWLSGLTCTDENFVQKAGAQKFAAEHYVAILCPDTSPRGETVPDDPDGAWDFGLGAGFYVDATATPWSEHYKMYSYITEELPALVAANFPQILDRQSIMGHSMGGHGALTIALKNPERFSSISAFAPICSPLNCPWGHKALGLYLGDDREQWSEYDSCALLQTRGCHLPILVDQGEADNFFAEQLKPELLEQAASNAGVELTLRRHTGYDHSYFFIASFIEDHIRFHANALQTK